MNNTIMNNTLNALGTLDTLKGNRGRFVRLNWTTLKGIKKSFVAQYRSQTDKSLTVFNTKERKNVVIPFHNVSSLALG